MISVVKSGTAIRYAIGTDSSHPQSAHSVSVALIVAGEEVYRSIVPFEKAVSEGVLIPAEATIIGGRREFAVTQYSFYDLPAPLVENEPPLDSEPSEEIDEEQSESSEVSTLSLSGPVEEPILLASFTEELIIESENLLNPSENSFADYKSIVLASFDIADVGTFQASSKSEQMAALISAYHAIASMRISLTLNHVIDPETDVAREIFRIASTRNLTQAMYAELKPDVINQFVRSQIVEANNLLGGNPIERQRLNGLLSHSAGESTHFYRTSKPLELPISKKAAVELRGLLNYAVRLSR